MGYKAFKTRWTKVDLMKMKPGEKPGDYWVGWGIRYTDYSMPLEFTHYREEGEDNFVDSGHEVIEVHSKGVSFVIKVLEPMIFGIDNGRWFFIDGDVGFGVSFTEAEELKDDVYGFQFNCELNAGVKHTFKAGSAMFGFKAGYRVFGDFQILAEWDNSDGESTSSTMRNLFHGPFVSLIGTF